MFRPTLAITLAAVAAVSGCTGLPGPFARPTTPAAPVTSAAPSPAQASSTSAATASASPSSPSDSSSSGSSPSPSATATSAPTSAPPATTKAAGPVLDVNGFGPLKVGMSLKEAEQAGLIHNNGYECDMWNTSGDLARRGLQIGSDGTSVTEVTLATTFEGQPGRTRSGAHVGMTFTQVRAIYGKDFAIETKNGNGGPFQAGVVRAGARELMFIPDYGDGSWQRPLTDAMKVRSITARDHSADAYGGC